MASPESGLGLAADESHGLQQLWGLLLLGTQQEVSWSLTAPRTSEGTENMHDGDSKPSWRFLTTSCECELGGAGSLELRGVGRGWPRKAPRLNGSFAYFPYSLPESFWDYTLISHGCRG